MTHDLKIHAEWFDLLIHRRKEFELRRDDRPFKEGDTLRLRLYDPKREEFLGPIALCRVGCVMRNMPGLAPGYVALSTVFTGMEVKHGHGEEA